MHTPQPPRRRGGGGRRRRPAAAWPGEEGGAASGPTWFGWREGPGPLPPPPPGGNRPRHYVLIDFAARWISGEPVAGDDAAEARFVPLSEVAGLVEWSETVRIIEAARQRFT